MEMNSFEEKLKQMSKPEISELKHQELLSFEILKAKDRAILSAWWLSIPLYMIACLFMKSIFLRGTTLISNLNELIKKDPNSSFVLFVLLPLVFAGLNVYSMYTMYSFNKSLKPLLFSFVIWLHLLSILVCLGIIIIYLI